MKTYNVLSIDAWADGLGGWEWNQWFNAGSVDLDNLDNTRQILAAMREQGFLSDESKGKVSIEDDQYNLVICDRNTQEPVFAIEYGNTI